MLGWHGSIIAAVVRVIIVLVRSAVIIAVIIAIIRSRTIIVVIV
jgi:hypothetical protein